MSRWTCSSLVFTISTVFCYGHDVALSGCFHIRRAHDRNPRPGIDRCQKDSVAASFNEQRVDLGFAALDKGGRTEHQATPSMDDRRPDCRSLEFEL